MEYLIPIQQYICFSETLVADLNSVAHKLKDYCKQERWCIFMQNSGTQIKNNYA